MSGSTSGRIRPTDQQAPVITKLPDDLREQMLNGELNILIGIDAQNQVKYYFAESPGEYFTPSHKLPPGEMPEFSYQMQGFDCGCWTHSSGSKFRCIRVIDPATGQEICKKSFQSCNSSKTCVEGPIG